METATIHALSDAKPPSEPTAKADRFLVRRAANGDRRAFQQIVERNKQRMFSVARGVLGSPDVAEDVVQEAFIKAYRALPDFRGDAELSTWLYRITYLTAIDHQRQMKRYARLARAAEAEAVSGAGPVPAGSADRVIEAGELGQEIESALARLSKFEQTVFTLRHMQNFKLREIAVVVDRSEGTVKNILFRAIRKLRDQLQDSQFGPAEIERC